MGQYAIDGLQGSVTLPNSLVQFVSSITLTTGHDLLDVSHYPNSGETAGWRSRIAGIADLSGQCVAFMTQGATGSCPFGLSTTPAAMTITYGNGCSIAFNAIIGNTQVVGEYQGLNIVTFSFAHSGTGTDVVVTWNLTS